MTTQLYSHPIHLEHLVPAGHPERPDRMKALAEALAGEEFKSVQRVESPSGSADDVLLAHPEEYLERVENAMPEEGISRIDADTVASPKTWQAALTAIGGALAATDAVMTGEADNAFVTARPPGHHAERNKAMGFCLFNNAAIAARHARKTYDVERVAIIDWDVHHGNGTQDIFWSDPSVLYCSTHQMPLYPGTGAREETGVGNIVNAPLSSGADGTQFREAFQSRILKAVDNFRPDLIIISAGFDAHWRDPLAEVELTEEDFDWATGMLMDRAGRYCDNRLVSLLEGGYDLKGLADSSAAHLRRLMKG